MQTGKMLKKLCIKFYSEGNVILLTTITLFIYCFRISYLHAMYFGLLPSNSFLSSPDEVSLLISPFPSPLFLSFKIFWIHSMLLLVAGCMDHQLVLGQSLKSLKKTHFLSDSSHQLLGSPELEGKQSEALPSILILVGSTSCI